MRLQDGSLFLSPSDVTAFLACEHLTTLQLAYARGELARPEASNEQADLIRRKGEEHERAFLELLRGRYRDVREIEFDGRGWEEAQGRTLEALRAGADVVYQGVFSEGRWRGLADFLVRVPIPSALGDWSYEALDTKLARSPKPAYILQLLFYNEQLARLQGREPDEIHVLLGSGEQVSFRPEEFGAYYRHVRDRLERFVAASPVTEPLPVEHCGLCDFRPHCDAHWDVVDHLSRVAGLQRRQAEKLMAGGLGTLAALGRAPEEPVPAGISADTFAKLREQAELQLWAREHGSEAFRVLQPQPETGLALLPDPSPGDLFFDFEGNPFWDASGGLEYLWGILDAERRFTPLHAHDHPSERLAFETFVDLVRERLERFPDLHVYHYAQYEITALRRLMGRYGTREAELDDLLRRGVFVDLYRVVRNGIRASRPGYGLKELERFLDFTRHAEVQDGGTSIVVFEQWMQTGDDALLRQIDEYNREDCLATLLLRDWLLERRAEALEQFGPFPLPEPKAPKPLTPERQARATLREQLLARGDDACLLAAQLLDYHERERKPVWWAFFDKVEMAVEELVEDSEAIGRLQPTGEPRQEDRSWVYSFTYPAQEQKLGSDPIDPATRNGAGRLLTHDREARTLELKRGRSFAEVPLPAALIPGRPYDTPDQEDALERIGRSLLEGGGRYPAIESILRRDAFDRPVQTNDLAELTTLLLSLEGRHLVIQGPPGSGKTWTSGRLIARLLEAGKTVGVASTSHRAIHRLLEEVEAAAAALGLDFRGLKKASGGNTESEYSGPGIQNVYANAEAAEADVVGGTAWLFSDPDLDATLDYLFIDEAGQVSLADALAMATCARNVVLVGDPQQLAQVQQGTHPDRSEASVLEHLLAGTATIAPDRGIFLEHTYRLHPDLCRYISAEFYESRLQPDPVTATRTTPFGTGLRWLPVEHIGRRRESREEVAAVRAEIDRLVAVGVAPAEIKVVAPYNAQVELLRGGLPSGVDVGTVDKFQGQQARVVFYSMASSSGDDVPRGLGFLLSRNRFNVAISRAQCLAYLVCSPRLLEVDCRRIEHMRLANALCRFVEHAHASRTWLAGKGSSA